VNKSVNTRILSQDIIEPDAQGQSIGGKASVEIGAPYGKGFGFVKSAYFLQQANFIICV